MLQRVERVLAAVVSPIVVVAAEHQALPALLESTLVVHDKQPNLGPLEGIRAGLAGIARYAEAAYVTSCDVPLLSEDFVRHVTQLCAADSNRQIVVPFDEQYHHPLAAVYRVGVQGEIEKLLSADRLRPKFLFELVETLEVATSELRSVDPDLHSLANVNRPEDYLAALKSANLPLSDRMREQFGLDGS